jgi:translation initiation factor 4A
MLDRGFRDQVSDIFKALPEFIQVGFFSSTLPEEVLTLTKPMTRNPMHLLIPNSNLAVEGRLFWLHLQQLGINHFYVDVEKEQWKLEVLCDLYDTLNITQSLVFCNTRR